MPPMPKRHPALLFLSLLSILLASACAPAVDDGPRVQVEQLNEPISFYPQETGATLQYLPDGARLSEQRLFYRIEGPVVLAGELVTGSRLVGRGIDELNYRRYEDTGVYLLRTVKPGSTIDFDPPVREFPSQVELREGASWSGETRATVTFPEARVENRSTELDVSYRYTVVDERTTTVPAGEFTVFVIDFESTSLDEEGNVLEELTQTIWFTPHVGEVRLENGYFLVATNFLEDEEEEDSQD